MPSRKSTLFFVVLPAAAVLAASGFIWSGAYDVGADSPHTKPVHRLLEIARERSILVRAAELDVPDLRDPNLDWAPAVSWFTYSDVLFDVQ